MLFRIRWCCDIPAYFCHIDILLDEYRQNLIRNDRRPDPAKKRAQAGPDWPRTDWVECFTRYIRTRRECVGLTVAEAAELSGLELSQWGALEAGWVPQEHATIRAIAGVLHIRWTDIEFIALIARLDLEARG